MRNRNRNKVFSIIISALAGAGFLFLTTALPAAAEENATLHGKTIGEWAAGWWQWQEKYYPDVSFGDGPVDCSLGQSGPVWYLGGTGGGPAERRCQGKLIPAGTHLMFPLVNANVFNPDDFCESAFGDLYCSVEQKREVLDGILSEDPPGIFNSMACLLQAEVDGVPVVYSTSIVRTQTPPHQYAKDLESVADGFWVVLPPLPSGSHSIHYTGGICDVDTGETLFDVDVTYTVRFK
jgi:hypothetical protein